MIHPTRKGMKPTVTDDQGSKNFPLITFDKSFPEKEILIVNATIFNGEKSVRYENKVLCPWNGCKHRLEHWHGKQFTSAFIEVLKETGKTFVRERTEETE